MSQILKRKVVYFTVGSKRYKFTKIIELLEPVAPQIIDLTTNSSEENESSEPVSSSRAKIPQHDEESTINTPGISRSNSPYVSPVVSPSYYTDYDS